MLKLRFFKLTLPTCGRVGRDAAGEGWIHPSPLALFATLSKDIQLYSKSELGITAHSMGRFSPDMPRYQSPLAVLPGS